MQKQLFSVLEVSTRNNFTITFSKIESIHHREILQRHEQLRSDRLLLDLLIFYIAYFAIDRLIPSVQSIQCARIHNLGSYFVSFVGKGFNNIYFRYEVESQNLFFVFYMCCQ